MFPSLLLAKQGDSVVGIDFGFGYIDIGAEGTAQYIANTSGSTVTYSYDEGTWVGRGYLEYGIDDTLFTEVGVFFSGEVNANYTLSGVTASEAYTANGIDYGVGVREEDSGLFLKAGGHSSEVSGAASITISGTTYNAAAAATGIGYYVGAGMDFDSSRIGYTYYANLGGLPDADVGLIYYGYRF
tara:strand:- start:41 stop:595 length:555 start_codon:yes stop_codon:yes gene_type:complete